SWRTQSRGLCLDPRVWVVLEADRLERPVHPPRVPDAAPDRPDAHLARGQLVLRGLLRPPGGVPHESTRHCLHRLLRLGARAVAELRRLDTALTSDLVHGGELRQSVHRRPHHVVRFRRAEALRQDVADADALHHRANRAAGDHTGARRRGLHPHLPCAVLADDLVRDRRSRERHRDEAAPRGLDGLPHRLGHFVRLARREAHLPLAVADGDERVEAEPATTLHDLRDAVDRDHARDQIAAFALLTATLVPTTSAAAAALVATLAA